MIEIIEIVIDYMTFYKVSRISGFYSAFIFQPLPSGDGFFYSLFWNGGSRFFSNGIE